MAHNFYGTAVAEHGNAGQTIVLLTSAFRRLPSPLELRQALLARRGFRMRLREESVRIIEAPTRAQAFALLEAGQ